MKIKVCGLKYADNIAAVAGLKPDYVGFIRYDRSPRFSEELPEKLTEGLSSDIRKTAVFVDSSFTNIVNEIKKYNFDMVQLHGREKPDLCKAIKNKEVVQVKAVTYIDSLSANNTTSSIITPICVDTDVQVIKAFGIDEEFDFNTLAPYIGAVDYFLFDTKTPAHGGSGKTFDWGILDKYELDLPFFLSGGLSLDNLAEVKNIKHPAFYGVDLNSKFEIEPGLKDIDKLKQAFALLNNI